MDRSLGRVNGMGCGVGAVCSQGAEVWEWLTYGVAGAEFG